MVRLTVYLTVLGLMIPLNTQEWGQPSAAWYTPAPRRAVGAQYGPPEPLIPPPPSTDSIKFRSLTVGQIKAKISHMESGGLRKPYLAVNQFGYLGKYQFHIRTLKTLGLTSVQIDTFLCDSAAQELAMTRLLLLNYEQLKKRGCLEYDGKVVGQIKISVEGMLAASHLLGPASVEHYLKNKGSMKQVKHNGARIRKYDGNNTSIKVYLRLFEEELNSNTMINEQRIRQE